VLIKRGAGWGYEEEADEEGEELYLPTKTKGRVKVLLPFEQSIQT